MFGNVGSFGCESSESVNIGVLKGKIKEIKMKNKIEKVRNYLFTCTRDRTNLSAGGNDLEGHRRHASRHGWFVQERGIRGIRRVGGTRLGGGDRGVKSRKDKGKAKCRGVRRGVI